MTLFEWYLARASGIVAFVLLTIAVVLGLTLSGRAALPGWPRFGSRTSTGLPACSPGRSSRCTC